MSNWSQFFFFFFWIRDDYIDKMKNTEISKGTKGTNQMVYRRCFQLAIRKEKLQLFKAGISLHQKKKALQMVASRMSL